MKNTLLTVDSVTSALSGLPLRVEVYDSLTSTNDAAKERGRAGEPEGLLIIARRQTRGKGRMGRSFFSPESAGLYMSLLLRPRLSPERSLNLTTAAAVSVASACEAISGRPAGIKWVNDVYMDGKKVCGILTESALGTNGLDFAVLGIGVNVCAAPEGFPEDIRDIAGTVFPAGVVENPAEATANLAGSILKRFWGLYEGLQENPERIPSFLGDYREKMLGIGNEVTVLRGEDCFEARLEGLDEDFRLILRKADGSVLTLSSGEIRIKLPRAPHSLHP